MYALVKIELAPDYLPPEEYENPRALESLIYSEIENIPTIRITDMQIIKKTEEAEVWDTQP